MNKNQAEEIVVMILNRALVNIAERHALQAALEVLNPKPAPVSAADTAPAAR